jgi:alkylhydroperoxidase family enzyme
MPQLAAIDPETTSGKTRELLEFVQERTGRIPNMIRLMANSPAALGAYLSLAGAFRDAELPARVRDLIAVAVAEAADNGYTLSAVSAVARNGGRGADELNDARSANSADPKIAAALRFAVGIVELRGRVPQSEVLALKDAGYSDGEIGEIVATIVLNLYRSYFSLVAQPEIDFPIVAATERIQA